MRSDSSGTAVPSPAAETTSGIESSTSPAPGRRQTPLARLGAALRGDKYMVDAYPPADSPVKTNVEVDQ